MKQTHPISKLRSKLRLQSLRVKLGLALITLAVLPLLLLAGITAEMTEKTLLQNANQSLYGTATQTALRLDGFIQANLDAMRAATQLPDITNYIEAAAKQQPSVALESKVLDVFRALLRRNGLNIISYTILDRQGKVLIDSTFQTNGQDQSDQDYFQQAISTGLAYASAIRVTNTRQELASLYFSSAIRDESGAILGALVMRYNAGIIQQLLTQSNGMAGDESFAILVDENHVRLAHGTNPELAFKSVVPLPPDRLKSLQTSGRLPKRLPEQLSTNLPTMERALHQATCASVTCPPVYTTTELALPNQEVHTLAITRMQTQPWFVLAAQPQRLLLAPIYAQLQMVLIFVGLIAISAIGVAFIVGRQFTQPIIQLTDQVTQFTAGDLAVRSRVRAKDEIGILAISFNNMAEQVGNLLQQRALQLVTVRQTEAQYRQKAQELEQTLRELQRTQSQLIQSEKMSSLGQLVAGVAHEINNPASFIQGNLTHAREYAGDLLRLMDLYQTEYPNPSPKLQSALDSMDLDFVQADFPKLFNSMQTGSDRIREIVLSLRNFARLDESEFKKVDLHEGIDSTLVILGSRLKATNSRPDIQVIKHYQSLPQVECYPGQLNQVFMNILSNAIDAIDERQKGDDDQAQGSMPTITIYTQVLEANSVAIRFQNTGLRIPEAVRDRLFDPFFTTKPVGAGTGMGLAISYQIITEKHSGKLWCESDTEVMFSLEIPVHQG
jgi:signal transduction histidine kinase